MACPLALGQEILNSTPPQFGGSFWYIWSASSIVVGEMLTIQRWRSLPRLAILANACSIPGLGNPIVLTRACSDLRVTRRGLGLPTRGSEVMVPTVVIPNPIASILRTRRTCLSNPAARPTGLGTVILAKVVFRSCSEELSGEIQFQ